MKTILEFNLPEDREDLEMYQSAPRMQQVLYDLYTYLRQNTKYASDEWSEEKRSTFEEVREEFNRILTEHNVDCI